MSKPRPFLFWPADWLSSQRVSQLSSAGEGAFIRLLCYQAENKDGVLPKDEVGMQSLTKLNARLWRTQRDLLISLFPECEGGRANQRLTQVLTEQEKYRSGQAEYGRKRWEGSQRVPLREPQGSHKANVRQPVASDPISQEKEIPPSQEVLNLDLGSSKPSRSRSRSQSRSESGSSTEDGSHKGSGKSEISEDERRVVAHLAEVTGKPFRASTSQLKARVGETGVDACVLVIDFLAEDEYFSGKGRQYLDNVTPFRPEKWESRLLAARQWDENGRTPSCDKSSSSSSSRVKAIDFTALAAKGLYDKGKKR